MPITARAARAIAADARDALPNMQLRIKRQLINAVFDLATEVDRLAPAAACLPHYEALCADWNAITAALEAHGISVVSHDGERWQWQAGAHEGEAATMGAAFAAAIAHRMGEPEEESNPIHI